MRKSVSDSTLNKLWSKAVAIKYPFDPITGQEGTDSHHVIPKGRQNRFAIRWEIRNGVRLTSATHRKYHNNDLEVMKGLLNHIEQRGDTEYLLELKNKLKPDFLKELGLIENEYRLKLKKELTAIIKEAE